MQARLRELYEGTSDCAHRFRYGLLAFDIATILFVIVTSFFDHGRIIETIDMVIGVVILAVGISGIQQFGGSFWVEPLFNGATLLIAIGIAGYAQRAKGAKSR